MRSAQPADPTTRDKIRDAAVLRFARSGFDASVRSIAADAGVSPALVIHHFGSKDGLHAACDEQVLAQIVEAKQKNMGRATSGQLLAVLAESEEMAPHLGYVLRSLQAGGQVAQGFIEHMIDDAVQYTADAVAQGIVKPSLDEAGRARYLVLSALGALLLEITLDADQDLDDLRATFHTFLAKQYLPMVELYTQGFLTNRRMLDDYLLYLSDPPSDGPDPTPANPTRPDDEEP